MVGPDARTPTTTSRTTSGPGERPGVLDQRGDRGARTSRRDVAVGAAGVEGRPRDVEVGPGQVSGELAKVRRGEQAAAPTDAVVLQEVGDLAGLDPVDDRLGDRHR